MFRVDKLSIIRRYFTVYAAYGIYHAENILGVYYWKKIKREECILLVLITQIYHDAQSSECQI
jgi:hypothetical protein